MPACRQHAGATTEMFGTCLEILRNLTHKPLEGELPDKKFGRLLIPPDLPKGNCPRAETMGLLHAARSLFDDSQSEFCWAIG
jgi:hypothetical protein